MFRICTFIFFMFIAKASWATPIDFSNTPLNTEFKDIYWFADAQDLISEDTLVLIDLDNTTLIYTQPQTSNQGIQEMINDLVKNKKYSLNEAMLKVFSKIWDKNSPNAMSYKLSDKKLQNFIDFVNDKKGLVFGFTGRPITSAFMTNKLLNTLEINFNLQDYVYSASYQGQLTPTKQKLSVAQLIKGVLFSDPLNTKGRVFKDFYYWLSNSTGKQFSKVILIDDTPANLQSVNEVAKSLNINFVGLHFVPVDTRK